MTTPHLDRDALELAALYAAGALPADERDAVRERYADVLEFWEEVRSLERAAHELFASAPRRAAPVGTWERLRERLNAPGAASGARPARDAQVWKTWAADAPSSDTVVRGDEIPWEPTSIPGIEARRLFVDRANDRITMMVRMAPGTAYPAHRHGGAEECYVLAGDLAVGESTRLATGDYQRMEAGSVHPVQSTDCGCILLLVSSAHDEVLPGQGPVRE